MHTAAFDLLHGMLIGFLISLPLGPVALITMKRTAEFGLRAGIISGLAVAIIDTAAAIAILFGLHHSIPFFYALPHWLRIGGAVIIFIYGLRMLFTDPVCEVGEGLPWQRHFFASALMALTNPSTYLSFGVIGLLLTRFFDQSPFERFTASVGFFAGAVLWWCILAVIAFLYRDRYRSARNINKVVGGIIMLFALLMLLPVHLPKVGLLLHFV